MAKAKILNFSTSRKTVKIKAGRIMELNNQVHALSKRNIKGHGLSIARNAREITNLAEDFVAGYNAINKEYAAKGVNGDEVRGCVGEDGRSTVSIDAEKYVGQWKRGMKMKKGEIVHYEAPAIRGEAYWLYTGGKNVPDAPGTGEVWERLGAVSGPGSYQLADGAAHRDAINAYLEAEHEVGVFMLPGEAFENSDIAAAEIPLELVAEDA